MSSRPDSLQLEERVPPRASAIAPGSKLDITLPIYSDTELKSFAITCTVLEDGSVAGNHRHVEEMLELAASRAYQIRRLLSILDKLRQSDDTKWRTEVRTAIESARAGRVRSTKGDVVNELLRAQALAEQSGDIKAGRAYLDGIASEHRIMNEFLRRAHRNPPM